MDLMHATLMVATTATAPTWWATHVAQTFGTLLATSAGVWIGARLVERRESKVRDEKRDADALFLAVTVSGMLERFVSDCANVASDDGTYHGQRTLEGNLEEQVPDASISYADLDVEWKSLPGKLLDQVHSIPRKLQTTQEYLKFIADHLDDDYFPERQIKFAELGLAAADASGSLRESVNLSRQIDPESTTVIWLKNMAEKLQEEKQKRDQENKSWLEGLTENDHTCAQ